VHIPFFKKSVPLTSMAFRSGARFTRLASGEASINGQTYRLQVSECQPLQTSPTGTPVFLTPQTLGPPSLRVDAFAQGAAIPTATLFTTPDLTIPSSGQGLGLSMAVTTHPNGFQTFRHAGQQLVDLARPVGDPWWGPLARGLGRKFPNVS
jgi:hypothetical protein